MSVSAQLINNYHDHRTGFLLAVPDQPCPRTLYLVSSNAAQISLERCSGLFAHTSSLAVVRGLYRIWSEVSVDKQH